MATTGPGAQLIFVSMAGGRLPGVPSHPLVSHQPREVAGAQVVPGAGKLGGPFMVKSELVEPSSLNPPAPPPVQLYLCNSTRVNGRAVRCSD